MENLVSDQLITPWLIFSLFSSPVCLILFEIFWRKFCDCHSWELKGWPVLDITIKNDLYFSLIWETFHDMYISNPNYALLGVGFSFTSVLFLLWTQAVDSFDFGPLFQALLLVDDKPLATKDEVFPQWLTTNFWQGAWKTRQKKLAKLQNTPQLWSASLTCVGRLWRSRHNTIDAILIQWHVNELRGILKLLQVWLVHRSV